jgi:hypothetical protein
MKKTSIGGDLQEVLFRGRDSAGKTGKWFKGMLAPFRLKGEENMCQIMDVREIHRVEAVTVGLFVGLDSKQQDVFVDDIVELENELYVVTWDAINLAYNMARVKDPDQYIRGYRLRNSVLVGNIFDNEDLLYEKEGHEDTNNKESMG